MTKKISKHYNISEELINKLNTQKEKKFKTEIEAVEYYLNKGLEKENKVSDSEKIYTDISKNLKYIKKLLDLYTIVTKSII